MSKYFFREITYISCEAIPQKNGLRMTRQQMVATWGAADFWGAHFDQRNPSAQALRNIGTCQANL
jgi:hypothetical protein